jgi:hypothetical protein
MCDRDQGPHFHCLGRLANGKRCNKICAQPVCQLCVWNERELVASAERKLEEEF